MSGKNNAVELDWLKVRAAHYREQANLCEGAWANEQFRDLRRMAWAFEFVHEKHLEQLKEDKE